MVYCMGEGGRASAGSRAVGELVAVRWRLDMMSVMRGSMSGEIGGNTECLGRGHRGGESCFLLRSVV